MQTGRGFLTHIVCICDILGGFHLMQLARQALQTSRGSTVPDVSKFAPSNEEICHISIENCQVWEVDC